ncbi:phosphate ABC transporter permease [Halobacteriales archaeon QS_4_69_225]|nr:MAG: phosphate ABC transporter permease [Halobacteriales archaeon QS_4_69_225]
MVSTVGLADGGLVVAGLVLVFFGAALSVYAVALLGFLLGAGGAYTVAPVLLGAVGSEGVVGLAVAVVAGGLVGAALAYVALSFATAVPSAVVGAYVGLAVVAPVVTDGGLLRYPLAALGGLAGAVVGVTLTKFALTFVTSFFGAALASGALSASAFRAAREGPTVEPLLVDPLATTPVAGAAVPLFAALFVIGLLSQVGLFRLGWVTRLAAVLPGARALDSKGG